MSALAHTTGAVLLVLGVGPALASCGGDEQGGPTASPTATVTETATATETATVTATPTDSPGARDCGQVAFEPNTDAGAFDIRASGVGCPVAREVAGGAEGQAGERYSAPEGFDCRPTETVGELPSVVYECTRGAGGTVTFRSS